VPLLTKRVRIPTWAFSLEGSLFIAIGETTTHQSCGLRRGNSARFTYTSTLLGVRASMHKTLFVVTAVVYSLVEFAHLVLIYIIVFCFVRLSQIGCSMMLSFLKKGAARSIYLTYCIMVPFTRDKSGPTGEGQDLQEMQSMKT